MPQCPSLQDLGVGDGGVTAGWGICRGHYLMLWVNGETAANSGACNPLPPLGWAACQPHSLRRALGMSPRQVPRRAACCSDSWTMGDVQKVSRAR